MNELLKIKYYICLSFKKKYLKHKKYVENIKISPLPFILKYIYI